MPIITPPSGGGPEDPYPYTFFTDAQIAYLGSIYEQARASAQARLVRTFRAATKEATTKDAIDKRKAQALADKVINAIYSYWPFLPISLETLGASVLTANDGLPYRLAWWLGPQLAPPSGVWRFGIDLAFYDSAPADSPDTPPNGKPPTGNCFLGDNAPLYISRAFYRALQLGRWANPAYTSPAGGRFGSLTQNAQNNTYRLFFPYPLWYTTPGIWALGERDETIEERGARLALEDYSAGVLSGEIEI